MKKEIGVLAGFGIFLMLSVSGCGSGGGGRDVAVAPPPFPMDRPGVASVAGPISPQTAGSRQVATAVAAAKQAKALLNTSGFGETGGEKLASVAGNVKSGSSNNETNNTGDVGDQTRTTKSKELKLPEVPTSGGGGGGGSAAPPGGGGGGSLRSGDTTPLDGKQNLSGTGDSKLALVGTEAGGGYSGGGGGGLRGGSGGEENSIAASSGDGGVSSEVQTSSEQSNKELNPLGSEDPEDYFKLIEMEESLFKRVTKRYFKKSTAWTLQDSREIVPRKRK